MQSVLRGSAAEQAGLAAGDELLALGDWRVVKIEDLVLLGALDAPQPLLVSRDRRLLRLTLPAAQAEGSVALEVPERAPAAALRRRKAWLQPAEPVRQG